MNTLPCIVHEAGKQTLPVRTIEIPEGQFQALDVEQASLPGFGCSFEQAVQSLSRLDRMFVEPDGSFVWAGDEDGQHWQIDGNMLDWGGRLRHVELQLQCPWERLRQLLTCLAPESSTSRPRWIFQLPRLGIYLSQEDFCRMLAS